MYRWLILMVACGSPHSAIVDAPPVDGSDAAVDATIDADPCAGGTCACATDNACGVHAYCNFTHPGSACACVAGYTDAGAGCAWTGVVADPGFVDPTAWTAARGAVVTPATTGIEGELDPGNGSCTGAQACAMPALSQTVIVPPYDRAQPLVLVVSHAGYAAIGIGDAWHELDGQPGFYQTNRICLGGAAYAAGDARPGSPVQVAVQPLEKSSGCPGFGYAFDVDRLDIVPANAGECPAPGLMINGDAESTGGWTFKTYGDSIGGLTAGVGQAGTRGALAREVTNCGGTVMANDISIPATGTPALEMYWSATAGSYVPVELDLSPDPGIHHYLTTLAGTGTGTTTRWCLSDAMRGRVVTLRALTPSVNGVSCQTVVDHQVVFDNVRVVDDPACAAADTGFESGHAPAGGVFTPPFSSVDELVDATLAHTGQGVLRLQGNHGCGGATFEARPIVPASNATGGPALTFFYNVPNNPNSFIEARTIASAFTLTEGGGWTAATMCLDPAFVGRPFAVAFQLYTSGTCTASFPAESAYLDDLVIGNDASCPSN